MNIETIDVSKDAAKKKLVEYRNSVKEQLTDEDKEIMRGYQAIAKGHEVLHVKNVIRDAGYNEEGLPSLAIARADADWCLFRRAYNENHHHVMAITENAIGDHFCTRQRFAFPSDFFPTKEERNEKGWSRDSKAMVPPVPAPLRPKHKLSNYHTLFEAEWKPEPPLDPILLRRIGGDLFVVVAQWNLTDLERAVLSGRFG